MRTPMSMNIDDKYSYVYALKGRAFYVLILKNQLYCDIITMLIKKTEVIMKKNNKIVSVIKNGCVIFTVITVLSYIAGTLLAAENKAFVPTLKWVLLFLAFSIVEAAANLLLNNKTRSLAFRLGTHFLATAILYFVIVVLCGGFIESGAQTLIAMAIFVIIYIVFALIYSIAATGKRKKKNKKEEYSSMFN